MEWRRKADGSWGNLPQLRSQDPFSRRPHTGLWGDTLNKHCLRESNFQKLADLLCYHENSGLSETKTKHLGSEFTFPQEEKMVGVWSSSEQRSAWFGAWLSLSAWTLRGSYFSNPAMLLQLFFQILQRAVYPPEWSACRAKFEQAFTWLSFPHQNQLVGSWPDMELRHIHRSYAWLKCHWGPLLFDWLRLGSSAVTALLTRGAPKAAGDILSHCVQVLWNAKTKAFFSLSLEHLFTWPMFIY